MVPASLALNSSNNPYFALISPNSIVLKADDVTVVEDRLIMSAKYPLPVIFDQNCPTGQSHGLFRQLSLSLHLSLNQCVLCDEQPVSRSEHNGDGFRYRVHYRPHCPECAQDSTFTTNEVTNPNLGELIVSGVPTFQPYEIAVQSVNNVGEADILGGEWRIGYSGEGSK